MERHYRFAGVELCVSMPEELFYDNEYHLAPFRVDRTEKPHIFRFTAAEKLDPPAGTCILEDPGLRIYSDGHRRLRYLGTVENAWENAYIRAEHRGREHDVQVKAGEICGRITSKTVLNSIEIQHLLARAGGFAFHCAYIGWNGGAILFTAPSETGKSTQAELWKKHRGAQIINGDRAAVRIHGGQILAEGIPFAGSSDDCLNRSLPVTAVVCLSQAPVTSIRRLRGYEAFVRIWEGCTVNTWDREDVALVSDAVKRLAETVPVFHLACTPDESAVVALENAMKSR